jgi:hypothetical protein
MSRLSAPARLQRLYNTNPPGTSTVKAICGVVVPRKPRKLEKSAFSSLSPLFQPIRSSFLTNYSIVIVAMGLFLFVAGVLCHAPRYERINVSQFRLRLQVFNGSTTIDEYKKEEKEKPYLIFRDPGDMENMGPETENLSIYWEVYGQPKEIEALKANFLHEEGHTVNTSHPLDYRFVVLKSEADWHQLSTFWVTLIVFLIFIGFAASALILWHCDKYSKDPQNSLLFVTEGNRIVTGE